MPKQLINGANIYIEQTGEGEETIVFSHGLLFNHHMWDEQVAHFKKDFRCIAYDHRGQGQSESVGSLDMDTLYEDAVALIESLSPNKRVHFVGLSMGGFVGMRLAARKPKLLKSLVLLDTSADAEPNKLKYILLNHLFAWGAAKLISEKVIRILFGKSCFIDVTKSDVLASWKRTIENHPKNITMAVAGVIHRKSVHDEISKIETKTLVAVGEEDVATTPSKSKKIHQAIGNSQFAVIKKAGHSSCIEQPESVNKLIRDFIGSASL